MNDKNNILIGMIVAPHGIRGQVRVQTYTEKASDLNTLSVVCSAFKTNAFHYVRQVSSSVIIAKIDGIDNRNDAENLRGTKLFITRDSLPELPDGQYYQTDLIGLPVYKNTELIGTVDCIHNFGAGDILELDNGDMLAFSMVNVDEKNKKIFVEQ